MPQSKQGPQVKQHACPIVFIAGHTLTFCCFLTCLSMPFMGFWLLLILIAGRQHSLALCGTALPDAQGHAVQQRSGKLLWVCIWRECPVVSLQLGCHRESKALTVPAPACPSRQRMPRTGPRYHNLVITPGNGCWSGPADADGRACPTGQTKGSN